MAQADPRLLLLIDDEPARSRQIAALAARDGWRTVVARDGDSAIAALGTGEGTRLAAAVIDHGFGGSEALELVAELRRLRPGLPIVVLTASTSQQFPAAAMRAGASDYLVKPVAPERLLRALRAAGADQQSDELQPLSEKFVALPAFAAMIGAAPTFRAALAVAAKAARSHGPVLITGESGTGKEMLVRAMHAASPRARLALRFVNAGGFPASQIDSVLFGHERGAFAGAFERQVGALEHAEGGTLVLDEVERLPPATQEKLERFLAQGDIQPLGAGHRLRLDVRLLACSNQPLAALVADGSFRGEFHRMLAAVEVAVPPLRERVGDIPALARHFLAKIGEQPGLRPLAITAQALNLLAAFDWPGNVRQLQAVLFRAAVFCDGDALTGQDFPHLATLVGEGGQGEADVEGPGVTLYGPDGHLRPLEAIEADVIRLAIGHYHGRMSEVARRLGIGRSTLYRKLAELGIENTV